MDTDDGVDATDGAVDLPPMPQVINGESAYTEDFDVL